MVKTTGIGVDVHSDLYASKIAPLVNNMSRTEKKGFDEITFVSEFTMNVLC